MQNALRQLGKMVQVFRSSAGLTQSELAERTTPPVSRTAIALLEQGRRLPDAGALDRVCRLLGIPEPYWQPLLDDDNRRIAEFEDILGELVGSPVSLQDVDGDTAKAARGEILTLLDRDLTTEQTFDTFRSLLVYYGVHPPSKRFFDRYLDADSFRTAQAFQKAVANYQRDAIRLFSTFADGYRALALSAKLDAALEPLQPRDDESYRQRTEWTRIVNIDEERLADLGYIAAERVKRESAERAALRTFLVELAKEIRQNGPGALTATSDKKRRKMDSLLRQFDPGSRHSLFSPLFLPDPDQLERKAEQVGPKEDTDLARMGETQSIAQQNLAHYLAADHLDVYVATSMRSDADFVSVNRFVSALFQHDSIRPLKLRFFNPTQSWIDDRVAKGLVEALMLRRASMTIYMAQKDDTFGKDSEASVALGQGKPVIVYVPKLVVPEVNVDTEALGRASREQLEKELRAEGVAGEELDFDDTVDAEALHGRLLSLRLAKASGQALTAAVVKHWADFDLYGEDSRIESVEDRAAYRAWLDAVVKKKAPTEPPASVRDRLQSILVATALRFERRARIFREVHPLALQVILSSGVLNGILVSRSVDSCADLIRSLIRNSLDLELVVDDLNYRLVEKSTGSTVRVISQHQLLKNAFATFYGQDGEGGER
jgi:transcriptional regulator with XRE-family HTH domain